MVDDYRNTKYCPQLTELTSKKNSVKKAVLEEHPKAIDMHRYISNNKDSFKQLFVEAYNGKCAYCGVSTAIIPWEMFEVDHFIPKEANCFENSKAKAGYIENLVLACYDCNRAKCSFESPNEEHYKIHPDSPDIIKSFVRDKEYYIKVSETMQNDDVVNTFYSKLKLDSQTHRIDYLLLSMRGLRKKITDKPSAYNLLTNAIDLLQQKRNVIR